MGSSWPTVSTSDASTYVTITSVVSLGAKVGSAKIRFPSLYIARAVRSLILASPAIILLCQAQRAKTAEFLSLNRTNICYGTRRHQGAPPSTGFCPSAITNICTVQTQEL